MAGFNVSAACARAREWSSLRLDGELSEFEGMLLDRHLACCAECREFDMGAAAVAEQLRGSALQPMTIAAGYRFRAPRRRPARPAFAASAAAVVVGAVVSWTALTAGTARHDLPVSTPGATAAQPAAAAARQNGDLVELRALRQAALRPSAILAATKTPRNLQSTS